MLNRLMCLFGYHQWADLWVPSPTIADMITTQCKHCHASVRISPVPTTKPLIIPLQVAVTFEEQVLNFLWKTEGESSPQYRAAQELYDTIFPLVESED